MLLNFCSVLFTFCSLLVTFCSLLVTFCSLLVTFFRRSLLFPRCLLLCVRCSFFFVRCSLLFIQLLWIIARLLVTPVTLIYLVDEFFIFSSLALLKEMRMLGESKISSCCICVLCKSRVLGGRGSPRFPCLTPAVESFSDLLQAIIS